MIGKQLKKTYKNGSYVIGTVESVDFSVDDINNPWLCLNITYESNPTYDLVHNSTSGTLNSLIDDGWRFENE